MNICVLIVGGDERVIALLDALRGMEGITLLGVCDVEGNSTAIQHARKLAVDTSVDPFNFILEKGADLIIETSGSEGFQKVLEQAALRGAEIVDSKAAELLLNLAQEVGKMESEFISMTSHELRTPLAAIKEAVMLILDGTAGKLSPEQNRFLTIAKRNVDRLATLIDDLRDLSKIEAGKMELKKVSCDISELINKALEPLQPLVRKNKLDLIYDMGRDLPRLQCDTRRISQVLANLVANAVKFTPAGGKITVASHLSLIADRRRARPRKFIEISVKDTGIGIEKKDFRRIFTSFAQPDSSFTSKFAGVGVGLTMCKKLVHMHGGKIWADSERGKGSTLSFTLPV